MMSKKASGSGTAESYVAKWVHLNSVQFLGKTSSTPTQVLTTMVSLFYYKFLFIHS